MVIGPLLFLIRSPCFFALCSFSFNTANNGAVTQGKMIAKAPKPQRQLTFNKKPSAALDPAKAVIMYGDEVKANAKPRFLRSVTSAASTQTV